jgi:hypothetical protein
VAFNPPPALGNVFTDTPGHWAEKWAEYMLQEEIVSSSPTYNPNGTLTRGEMAVFIGRAMNRKSELSKGLAFAHGEFPEDIDALGAEWYYTWGPTGSLSDERYVPMYRGGVNDRWLTLPADYAGYILLFNEPNNGEPYGCSLPPAAAAAKYQEAIAFHPNAKFVVGGVSAWLDVFQNYAWLVPFQQACVSLGVPIPTRWHVHGYVESWITADKLIEWWRKQLRLVPGDLWITEFGSVSGSVGDYVKLIEWMKSVSRIKRMAAFTNRLQSTDPWMPPGWEPMALLNWDGTLRPHGEYYQQVA